MAMAGPCHNPSSLSSSPLPGTFSCDSRQQIQLRWDHVVKTSSLSLMRNQKSLFKMQQNARHNQTVCVHAEYDARRGGGSGDFVAGFIFGGVVFGALGYIFAPQVNKLLAGVGREREEASKRLPKGLDDDEGIEVNLYSTLNKVLCLDKLTCLRNPSLKIYQSLLYLEL